MDRMTQIGQKGYSKTKQCQEVLISIIEGMSRAKQAKKKCALISLDIKKAFDSTSHKYLEKVYKSFNMGPNIIAWMRLICTNRQACIILEDGSMGNIFQLQRGNAQGDTISPFIFNLGYQILLFKLTFDLQIAGIDPVEEPAVAGRDQPDTVNPVKSRYPRKVFAFADDGNLLVMLDAETIKRVKLILERFGEISGLECNIEKTALMPFGTDGEVSKEIRNVGFTVVDRLTVLGLVIDKNDENFTESFDKILNKIRVEIRNWARFNLSLPGRINIAKTMMYSQINYLGCFLPVSENFIRVAENLIESFILGKLNVAKTRRYLSREEGGMGLFKIREFLQGQNISWIKRASKMDEYWKREILNKSLGSVFNIRARYFDKNSSPILFNLASSYEKFLVNFSKKNENYKMVPIFENNAFSYGLENQRIKQRFFFRGKLATEQHLFEKHEN
jgi:hypothetical protein